MDERERARCAALAALLQASAVLSALSLLLDGAALLLMFGKAMAPVLLLGLGERYFAYRIALDRRLFEALADGRIVSLPLLDDALDALGLRKPAPLTRSLDERIAGTRRLLKLHAVVVALQLLAALAGGWIR
ncbi:hypothetical protein [Pelomonas sp. KK5]|uniref:hypothetical protein n=1 Tax=Pelomonas sp. KK5 TaxID=1855730 RepID=UPI00097C9870|nr:hypothetical protein [Pelomonas sp. KK5]